MRSIILSILLTISTSVFAQTLEHKITRGLFHKSGKIVLTVAEVTNDTLITNLDYQIKVSGLGGFLPKKHRQGRFVLELPAIFETEEGYRQLKLAPMKHGKAIVSFIRHQDVNGYKNAYMMKYDRSDRGYTGYFWYHPDVHPIGWIKAVVEIKREINYKLESNIVR